MKVPAVEARVEGRVCVFAWLSMCCYTLVVLTDHEVEPDVARYRGSLNEDFASSSWSSPYTERNVSHSVAYTSSGKGTVVS